MPRIGSLSSVLPVKYPLLCAASLQVPFSVQCHAAMRSSLLLRYEIGPHPADRDSWMIWGVKTLSMPARERTSIELPSALSGSNELTACPGVTSTCTVPGCADAELVIDWLKTTGQCANEDTVTIAIAAPRVMFSDHALHLRTFRIIAFAAFNIPALLQQQHHFSTQPFLPTNIRGTTRRGHP